MIKRMVGILLLTILGLTYSASADTLDEQGKTVVMIMMDDLAFPLVVDKPAPDTTPPPQPRFTISPPATTYEKSILVEISGEAGSFIFINGRQSGKIDSSGKAIITLDTSGANGNKTFHIVLRDHAGNTSKTLTVTIRKVEDPKYNTEYKGLTLYHKPMDPSAYKLSQLSDADFNALNPTQKRQVANTLLSTLFFGYPLHTLEEKIATGHFISSVYNGLQEERTDKGWLESYILDDDIFRQYNSQWYVPQAVTILTRFYAMNELDSYFFKNWIAYILTQTIMFSPAHELESTHTPDIANVYNRIFHFLDDDAGMRFITYVHMMSEENWRRFRSPEDNGREMLEIFQGDMEDSHVPIAAQALQNWKLNTDSDTLEVGLNDNTQPLHLFGTIIVNGDDFYRELVKSAQFTKTVSKRLVDFFFPDATVAKKAQITNAIVSSHPETWQDILLQIIFSKAYLLHNNRAKSAEETFYSFAKKLHYLHRRNTFYVLKEYLDRMHQATMKYKLGKLERVPLDTFSFAYYHKFIRENVLLRRSSPDKFDDYNSWSRQGWSKAFVTFDKFAYDENNPEQSLVNFINYIFKATISREATPSELALFKAHMLYTDDQGKKQFHYTFNMFATYDDPDLQAKKREERKSYIASLVLDYISRLEETYTQKEVH
jgi:hypothetical protein